MTSPWPTLDTSGLSEQGKFRVKQGMIAAYMDLQQFCMDRLRDAPPYTDTRVASELLDLCNDRLMLLNDGTVTGSLEVTVVEVTEDGAEQRPGDGQQPEG